MRGMLFTHAGADFTQFCAQRAHAERKGGGSSHPLRREQADVGAITTEPDASRRQILPGLMRHADHVVSALVANPGTGQAGLDAGFHLLPY